MLFLYIKTIYTTIIVVFNECLANFEISPYPAACQRITRAVAGILCYLQMSIASSNNSSDIDRKEDHYGWLSPNMGPVSIVLVLSNNVCFIERIELLDKCL